MDDARDAPASALVLRPVTVPPGSCRPYREDDWRDALVVVKRGEIELESMSGVSHRFTCGDLLWLTGLPLRALHNRGSEPTLLVVVSRR